MGPLGVERANKFIELGLLLQAVHASWPGCFGLEGSVHAFVPSVLGGVAWLDTFDGNAEAEPPDRELGEIVEAVGAGEWQTVVGADGVGQTALLEQTNEGFERTGFLGRLQGFAQQNET